MTSVFFRLFLTAISISASLQTASAQLVTSDPSEEKNVLQVSTETKQIPSISVINNQNATFYPESLAAIERALTKTEPEEVIVEEKKELSFGTSNQTVENIKEAFETETHGDIQIKPEEELNIEKKAKEESR
ncbi:MAG: hypothetical protein KGR46_07915 [Verrucomicrobia bacterium]|nr:hypothetical protein [Verrucomicrobiota bacterium]